MIGATGVSLFCKSDSLSGMPYLAVLTTHRHLNP